MLLNCGVGEDSWGVPWTARRSNQSILKEISPEYSLEGLMLKLKLQYLGHLMWRTDSLEKTLTLGKIEGRRRRVDRGWDGWMVSPIQWTWVLVDSSSWWWIGRPGMLHFTGSQRLDTTKELNWNDNPLQYSCLKNSMDRGAWNLLQGYSLWRHKRVGHSWVAKQQ